MLDCPVCKKQHRSEFNVRRCIVQAEWRIWCDYLATLPPNGGTTEPPPGHDRFTERHGIRPDDWWIILRWNIQYHRDHDTCQECGVRSGPGHHVDFEVHHIVPRCRGGSHHPANLITLCAKCHRVYTDELLGDLGAERRFRKASTPPPFVRPFDLEGQ